MTGGGDRMPRSLSRHVVEPAPKWVPPHDLESCTGLCRQCPATFTAAAPTPPLIIGTIPPGPAALTALVLAGLLCGFAPRSGTSRAAGGVRRGRPQAGLLRPRRRSGSQRRTDPAKKFRTPPGEIIDARSRESTALRQFEARAHAGASARASAPTGHYARMTAASTVTVSTTQTTLSAVATAVVGAAAAYDKRRCSIKSTGGWMAQMVAGAWPPGGVDRQHPSCRSRAYAVRRRRRSAPVCARQDVVLRRQDRQVPGRRTTVFIGHSATGKRCELAARACSGPQAADRLGRGVTDRDNEMFPLAWGRTASTRAGASRCSSATGACAGRVGQRRGGTRF